jgi:sigma-B regulation protein RsbU (phosphoserine phosphatase)
LCERRKNVIRAFLVDDEPPARARLKQLLAEIGDVVVVGEAGNAADARPAIRSSRPDVVFLDIEMPEERGIDLAASLPEPRPFLIFATAYERFAVEAFAVAATDYLLKPITRGQLAGTLSRVRDRLSQQTDLEREMAAASATQAWLLPRSLPRIAGFDCAAVSVPARLVGGDFYLAQPLADGRFTLALGDVAGKGMPAGLVASSVQARLETTARHAADDAPTVVGDVNRALSPAIESARFATLAYIELNPASSECIIVNAGHLPVIVFGAGRTNEVIASTGPALGMFPDAQYGAHRLSLAPGTMLVAYSDGITEAVNEEGDEFGETRLVTTIERHAAASAAELCQAVIDAARNHRGGRPAQDDVTVLVIKRA